MFTNKKLIIWSLVLVSFGFLFFTFIYPKVTNFFNAWPFHPRIKAQIEIHKNLYTNPDGIFMGNSIMFGADWSYLLHPLKVANYAIPGENSANAANRLIYVLEAKPGFVCLMTGINDLLQGNQPATVIKNTEAIVNNLTKKNITVYLHAVLYTTKNKDVNKKVRQINIKLSELAKQEKVFFINLNNTLAPGGFLLKKYSYDGIHLNHLGYKHWVSTIKPNLPHATQSKN